MTYLITSNDTKTWAYSLVRHSDGLLIRRSGVQIPLGPLRFFFEIFFTADSIFADYPDMKVSQLPKFLKKKSIAKMITRINIPSGELQLT